MEWSASNLLKRTFGLVSASSASNCSLKVGSTKLSSLTNAKTECDGDMFKPPADGQWWDMKMVHPSFYIHIRGGKRNKARMVLLGEGNLRKRRQPDTANIAKRAIEVVIVQVENSGRLDPEEGAGRRGFGTLGPL
ncbi:somatic embryogenesis receptor-like kinase 4 [Striga asiatica]|uniref:Somatic embryogenesis receptor-like kinase 4 n=1 Tax=Striga asiatica TaxID=4170 RepID=A0A5A7PJ34_STRAF|nr:somatic embryogenesis receptor-like kinase 4 [Striga asiatica]